MNAQGSEAELTVAAERGRAGIDGELVGAAPEMTALGGNEHRIPVGAGRQRPASMSAGPHGPDGPGIIRSRPALG